MSTALEVGKRIRAVREGLDLTLDEVGARAGLSKGQLSKVELGAPRTSPEQLARIAAALGVTVGDLFAEGTHKKGSRESTNRDSRKWGRNTRSVAKSPGTSRRSGATR